MYPRKKTAAGNCGMKDTTKKDVINNEELNITQSTYVCFLNSLLLEHSGFRMLCQYLLDGKMNPPHIYEYTSFRFTSRLGHHRAGLPKLTSRFSLVIYSIYSSHSV